MVSKLKKITRNKKGQAMAEFALTIPVFLLLVFGIIELSRFFLVYSSVFTAVREATRFGSSVGDEGILNYLDCSEIAETAVRTGHFGGVQKDFVNISYEAVAPESDEVRVPIAGCSNNDPGTVPEVIDCENDCEYSPSLGDRIYIEIETDYESLLGVVPNLSVDASSGRTIMLGVQSQVAVVTTEEPEGESTPEPTEDTTTPEPTEDTTTPEPTEVTTTPEPTEDPSTPEPTEDPTEEIICPTNNILFTGNTDTNNGQKTIKVYLKNETAFDYKITNFDNINWTRFYERNRNQTYDRKLSGLMIDNKNILLINYEPPTGKISPNYDDSLIDDTENSLPITFQFTDSLDEIGLTFTINFSKLDGTCSQTLNYSGN